MDYKVYNTKKAEGWKTNTKEDFEKWLSEFRQWFQCQTFRNGEEKEQFAQQIKDLKEKKEVYFEKGRTFQKKESFIFRPEEGAAFIRLCDALSGYLNKMSAS